MSPSTSEMDAARWRRVRHIFTAASNADSSDRRTLLQTLCGTDEALRAEVEELLDMRKESGLALDRPPISPEQHRQLTARYQPGDRIENYTIVRFVARGGMGEVYEAQDADGRTVALKFVRQARDGEGRAEARFLREVRLSRQIEHPNVCRVYDLGEHDGSFFCAMELLQGETLSAKIERQGKLTPAEALPIATQLCDGLQAAHDAGVLHRDLKPSNVLLVDGRAVIIDFGLAAASAKVVDDDTLTASGAVIGTLAYMAPEQLEQGSSAPAADLYSLAVVFYEMLAGEKPHDAKSPFRLAAQKARESHKTPSGAGTPAMPAVWREVITRSLKANPAERYPSAAAMKQALQSGRPSARFVLSQPRVFATIAAVLVALCGWGGWTWARQDHVPPAEAARLYADGYSAMTNAAPMRAIRALEKAAALDPKFVNAQSLLAVAHSETDQVDKAKDTLLGAIDAQASRWFVGRGEAQALSAANAAVLHDFKNAAEQYRKLAAFPAYRDYALLWQGRSLQQAGKFDDATRVFKSIDVPAAHMRLVGLLSRKREYEAATAEMTKAEVEFQKAGNVEGLCELWISRAVTLRSQTRKQNRQDLERAIETSAKLGNKYQNLMARLRLVTVLESEKDYDRAVSLAKEVASEAQRDGMFWIAASATSDRGYAMMYLKQHPAALPVLREAVELAKRAKSEALMTSIRMQLGENLASQRQNEEAVEVLEKAVDWQRRDGGSNMLPLYLVKYGTALQGSSRFAEAPKVFLEANDLAAKSGDLLFQTMALQRLGSFYGYRDLRTSLEYWETAMPFMRETHLAQAYFQAANVWRYLGEFARASELVAEGEESARKHEKDFDQQHLRAKAREGNAYSAFFQGKCKDGMALISGLDPTQPKPFWLVARMGACLGVASSLQRVRQTLSEVQTQLQLSAADDYFVAAHSVDAGDLALHLGDWGSAKRHALAGIAASRPKQYKIYEFENTLVLRAAEAKLGNRVEADRLTGEALRLARELGFRDPVEQFGGRQDLVYFWKLGNR